VRDIKRDNGLVSLSVVIPVFNTSPFLEECLDSVIEIKNSSLQIVVVNDGSTDSSREILNRYEVLNQFLVIDQTNQGLSAARNRGLEECVGDYILFLDSDDKLDARALSSVLEQALSCCADLVVFDICLQHDSPQKDSKSRIELEKYYMRSLSEVHDPVDAQALYLKLWQSGSYLDSANQYLIKKEVLDESKIRFYPGLLHEDLVFSIELFFSHRFKRCVYFKQPVYIYRKRDGSIMSRKPGLKSLMGHVKGLRALLVRSFCSPRSLPSLRIRVKHLITVLKKILKIIFIRLGFLNH
jgi:glycosyltransferase involved in cell wall biosynthesis